MPKTIKEIQLMRRGGQGVTQNWFEKDLWYSQSEVDELARIHKEITDKQLSLSLNQLRKELWNKIIFLKIPLRELGYGELSVRVGDMLSQNDLDVKLKYSKLFDKFSQSNPNGEPSKEKASLLGDDKLSNSELNVTSLTDSIKSTGRDTLKTSKELNKYD